MYSDQVLIDRATLQHKIAELGMRISQDYEGKDLVLIGILKGAFMFLADFSRAISIPHEIDFMQASSYGSERESSGKLTINHDVMTDLTGRHVLVVEDIIDTGHALKEICAHLAAKGPATLQVCCLLDKVSSRKVEVSVKYVGFEVPGEWVYGFGLDNDEYCRGIPNVCVLPTERYDTDWRNSWKVPGKTS